MTQAILSSIPSHIAVIDNQGTIVTVNKPWTNFLEKNSDGAPTDLVIGVNYLSVCRKSAEQGDENAKDALAGIQSVLSGEQDEFSMEYPYDAPAEKRWFIMKVVPLNSAEISSGTVIVHENITARKLAEIELREHSDVLEKKQNSIRRSTIPGKFWNL